MKWVTLLVLLSGAFLLAGCGDDDGSTGNDNQVNGNEPAAYTQCGTWVEGTMDADDGATRDYYNRGASLPWRNYLGDWHDASDIPQGDAPFAMITLVDDNTPAYAEWDVTTLVQAWVDGDYHARGFHLRGLGGEGPYNFYSKEHLVDTERPELVIVTAEAHRQLRLPRGHGGHLRRRGSVAARLPGHSPAQPVVLRGAVPAHEHPRRAGRGAPGLG